MDSTELLQALLGFLLGAVSTFLGLYWKVRAELEAQYDKDLRAERTKAYAALWKLLQPLAKYARPDPVTPLLLRGLSADLRTWYFEVGGLFMSERARDAYFALQDEIVRLAADEDRPLPEAEFEALRRKGSALRTASTVDVGSRRKPLLPDEASA